MATVTVTVAVAVTVTVKRTTAAAGTGQGAWVSQRGSVCVLVLLAVLVVGGAVPVAAQAGSGQLFPSPFLVEHHLVQTGSDGSVFATEPTVDHYNGSTIVSVRADGSRLLVDLAQRTITEVRPARSTYTVLTFDQMVELQQRLRDAERAQVGLPPEQRRPAEERKQEQPAFRVDELPVLQGAGLDSGTAKAGELDLLQAKGVRHLRISLDEPGKAAGDQSPVVEVWVDPGLRLTQQAVDALSRFESEVLAAGVSTGVPFSRYVHEARRQAAGAFPIRTAHALSPAGDPAKAGMLHDITTRLEPVTEQAPDLAKVPDGYQRSPHALELMVRHAEEEAARNMKALQAVSSTE